jgi:DNA topoisomerase-3
LEIKNFKSKPFYEVKVEFNDDQPFEATLLVPKGVEPFVADGADVKESPKAFLKQGDALDALTRVMDTKPKDWTITDDEKEGSENAPVLFSLTELQKWCNQMWGWEASRTLAAAQQAYEADKTLSYPRTDASFLPVDSKPKMDEVYRNIRSKYLDGQVDLPGWSVEPSKSTRVGYLFDDSKLTDHYAIVPTGLVPGDPTSDAGKVWLAVVRRFISAFGPAARTVTLKRRCEFGSDVAVASGKRYIDRGWIAADDLLAPLVGQSPKVEPDGLGATSGKAPVQGARLHEGKTTPPKPLTESTLLALMENIHTKLDTDEDELKEVLAGKGLGTPATRAATIELLVSRKYISRVKKGKTPTLQATEPGHRLIGKLGEFGLRTLTQPDTTAEWESALTGMEKATQVGARVPFLEGIMDEVGRALDILKGQAPERTKVVRTELADICPISGKPVSDCGVFWEFPGFGRVSKQIAGRNMSLEEIIQILSGSSPTFEGFLSKTKSKFSAQLKVNLADKKLDFVFPEREVKSAGHSCPMTGKEVEDHGIFWKFPNMKEPFWKTMAQRAMTLEEYSTLVEEGSVGPLAGFVAKSGSAFEAKLVLKDGKPSFDFPDRGKPGPSSPGMKGPGAKGKKSGGSSSGSGGAKKKKKTW